MKKYLFYIILFAFTGMSTMKSFAQWTQVGADLGFASNSSAPALAFHASTNEAYIAYADGAANAFVVQMFNGSAWTQVGTNLGFASNGSVPSLAFDPATNEAYIAYADGAANGFIVEKFNGTGWTLVGDTFGFASNNSIPSLAFDPVSNEPYVAYPDGAANAFIVQKFNGTNWTQVGTNLGFASNGSAPSLAFNTSTNEAYVAYPDGAANAFVVQMFNGTSWTQVGANLGFASSGVAPSLAFNPISSEALIAYPDGAANAFIVQMFNGTNWTLIGDTLGFASGGFMGVTAASLSFNPITNETFIAYPDGALNAFVIQKFNGTIWQQLGTNLGSTGGDVAIASAFKPCENEIFVAYADAAANAFIVQDYTIGCTLSTSTHPASQSINSGDSAEFHVSSSYPCTITYQWQTDIGFGFQNITNAGQYSGALNDTLLVANTTMNNNNQIFRCILSSGSCSDTSDAGVLTVINTTGLSAISINNSFSVFPNPAGNQINLKAGPELIGSIYKVYNPTGKIIMQGKINQMNTTIELNNLISGIYLFRVGENMSHAFKVVIK